MRVLWNQLARQINESNQRSEAALQTLQPNCVWRPQCETRTGKRPLSSWSGTPTLCIRTHHIVCLDRVLASATEPIARSASSRLKSKVYSRLLAAQAESGPLRSLTATKAEGRQLCLFEELVQISPVGETLKEHNLCRVCHARLLGEKVEQAPIYWSHCPYVLFQER